MNRQQLAGSGALVVIELWADLGCPWCYVGKHRLQRAIDRRPDADRFQIKLRSFELNPNAPREPESIESAFTRSHGGNLEVVLAAERRIQGIAEREGLAFSLERLNANTFDFHRVLHYANGQGRGLEFFSHVQDRLFAGELNPFDPMRSPRPPRRWVWLSIACWRSSRARTTPRPHTLIGAKARNWA